MSYLVFRCCHQHRADLNLHERHMETYRGQGYTEEYQLCHEAYADGITILITSPKCSINWCTLFMTLGSKRNKARGGILPERENRLHVMARVNSRERFAVRDRVRSTSKIIPKEREREICKHRKWEKLYLMLLTIVSMDQPAEFANAVLSYLARDVVYVRHRVCSRYQCIIVICPRIYWQAMTLWIPRCWCPDRSTRGPPTSLRKKSSSINDHNAGIAIGTPRKEERKGRKENGGSRFPDGFSGRQVLCRDLRATGAARPAS